MKFRFIVYFEFNDLISMHRWQKQQNLLKIFEVNLDLYHLFDSIFKEAINSFQLVKIR